MTSKAALCKALLDGRTVNIKNGFEWFGITNIPREIGRSIEREFDVKVTRTQREGLSRYKQPCNWVDYKLPRTGENMAGIARMLLYIESQMKNTVIRTDQQKKELKQLNLL